MGTRRSLATLCVGVLGLVACVGIGGCRLLTPPKVMLVMMENQSYSSVIGNAALPYVDQLAQHYGSATDSYSLTHGSLPNYLEIVSGSVQGVTDDGPPSSHSFPVAPTLADQLASGGYSVAAYAEDLPADPTNDSGLYAVRHDPWEYFPSARITVKDASALIPDLNAASPPDFVWYSPNLTDDGDTGVPVDDEATELAATESFLSTFIPSVQSTSWYKSGGQIIIEWDEGVNSDIAGIDSSGGGHIPTLVVSQALAANPQQLSAPVATAGILHSLEHLYQVPYLGDAAVAANGNIESLLYW